VTCGTTQKKKKLHNAQLQRHKGTSSRLRCSTAHSWHFSSMNSKSVPTTFGASTPLASTGNYSRLARTGQTGLYKSSGTGKSTVWQLTILLLLAQNIVTNRWHPGKCHHFSCTFITPCCSCYAVILRLFSEQSRTKRSKAAVVFKEEMLCMVHITIRR